MKATKSIYKVLVALLVSAQLFAATGCNEKSGSAKPASEKEFKKISLTQNGEGLCVEYEGKKENLVIPSTIQDKPVLYVKITDFSEKIKSVVIPEGVKRIDVSASGLKNIQLPSTLIYLSLYSRALEQLEIPKGVVQIFDISAKNLKSITIPEGVKYLGPVGGVEDSLLESVTLPKSIKFISNLAFVKHDNLKEINIPEEGLSVFVYGTDAEYMTPQDCFTGKAIDNSVALQEKLRKIKNARDKESFRSAREKDYVKWYNDNIYPITGGFPGVE